MSTCTKLHANIHSASHGGLAGLEKRKNRTNSDVTAIGPLDDILALRGIREAKLSPCPLPSPFEKYFGTTVKANGR